MESEITVMAVKWWFRKRPPAWTIEQHICNPTINCRGPEEYTLAHAVVKYVQANGYGETKNG